MLIFYEENGNASWDKHSEMGAVYQGIRGPGLAAECWERLPRGCHLSQNLRAAGVGRRD